MLTIRISTLSGDMLAQVTGQVTGQGTGLYAGGKVVVNGVKFQVGCNLTPVKPADMADEDVPAFRRAQLSRAFSAAPATTELPKPAAQAALAAEKPTFVMRADVRKLVNDGRVPEKDAEAFQSLCDSTTKTASEVLAELSAGKAAPAAVKSNGRKSVKA